MRAGLLAGRVAAGGFDPTDISDLVLWLDAADSGTITDSSGLVTLWADKSTSGYDMAIVAKGPQTGARTINGLNALDFDASNSEYLVVGPAFLINPTTRQWTVFAVVEADTVAVFVQNVLEQDNSGGRFAQYLRLNNSTVQSIGFRTATAAATDSAGTAMSASTPSLLRSVQTGTTIEAFINGNSNGSTSMGGTQTYGGSALRAGAGAGGTSTPQAFWDGAIAEIIVYSRALSGGEITDVETYLEDKWGL